MADGCSKGRLLQCSCDTGRPSEPPSNGENWVWGGCADDVGFAYTKSKEFVDVERKHGNDFGIVLQHHNYEAGRLVSEYFLLLKYRIFSICLVTLHEIEITSYLDKSKRDSTSANKTLQDH